MRWEEFESNRRLQRSADIENSLLLGDFCLHNGKVFEKEI